MPSTSTYRHISSRCFVNAPWYVLKERYLDLFLEHGIQPEIGLEGLCLHEESPEEFQRVSEILQRNRLSCTLHAPFFDLAPGALDPEILLASRNKLKKAAELIPVFKPQSMVCHLHFEENKQGYKREEWFAVARETWAELAGIAERYGCPLLLENTYETSPAAHESIFQAIHSQNIRFCLDTGHLMSFAKTPWQDWLPRLSPWLGQLHLHDNNGEKDEHLGLGKGNFDFRELFEFLAANNLSPLITLEPHTEDDLWHALDYLNRTKLLDML